MKLDWKKTLFPLPLFWSFVKADLAPGPGPVSIPTDPTFFMLLLGVLIVAGLFVVGLVVLAWLWLSKKKEEPTPAKTKSAATGIAKKSGKTTSRAKK